MSKITIMNPIVEEYGVSVSLPMTEPIVVSPQVVDDAEIFFMNRRNRAEKLNIKDEYDRARALIKWATNCSATLKSMKKNNNRMVFEFGFQRLEDLSHFKEYMKSIVNSATYGE